MLGNLIRHTHNGSGGSGPLTLASVAGWPGFDSVFGTSGTRLVQYVIREYSSAAKTSLVQAETGIGSLALAAGGGTLTRSKRTSTWDGSTYDDTSPAALTITATAANVDIECAALADSANGPMPFYNVTSPTDTAGGAPSPHTHPTTASAAVAGREFYQPYYWIGRGEVVAVGVYVGTGAAGTNIKLALYEVGSDGRPGALVRDFGAIGLATSNAFAMASVSGLTLPPGWYYFRAIADSSSPTLMRQGASFDVATSPAGTVGSGPVAALYRGGTYSDPTPDPATLTGLAAGGAGSTTYYAIYMRPAN